MYEDTALIAQSQRPATFSNEYRSVVSDKGALVFHMLRTELGDDAFNSLLHDFYKKYEGKTATIAEFEAMAKTKVPPPVKGQPPINLTFVFGACSTRPAFLSSGYITYRTPKGFKAVAKIHQDLDTFRMPVEIRVDTEGNPEFKKLLVSGTTSDFTIETFGRPKPNGIVIDPNTICRNRVRGCACCDCTGEGYAELGKYYEVIQEYQEGARFCSREIRWRISGWARRCSTRRIISRPRMRSGPRWVAIWIRSGRKSGATSTSGRFGIYSTARAGSERIQPRAAYR